MIFCVLHFRIFHLLHPPGTSRLRPFTHFRNLISVHFGLQEFGLRDQKKKKKTHLRIYAVPVAWQVCYFFKVSS